MVPKPLLVKAALLVLASTALFLWGTSFASTEQPDGSRKRIIVVGAATTEAVFALGGGDLIVGVCADSVTPDEALKLPRVWGDGRLLMNPAKLDADIALVEKRAYRAASWVNMTREGSAYGMPDWTPGILKANFVGLGKTVGREREAKEWLDGYLAELERYRRRDGPGGYRPRVVCVFVDPDSSKLMIASVSSRVCELVYLAGGYNVGNDVAYAKPLDEISVIEPFCDYVLISREDLWLLETTEPLVGHRVFRGVRSGQLVREFALPERDLRAEGIRIRSTLSTLASRFEQDFPSAS